MRHHDHPRSTALPGHDELHKRLWSWTRRGRAAHRRWLALLSAPGLAAGLMLDPRPIGHSAPLTALLGVTVLMSVAGVARRFMNAYTGR